MKRTWRIAMGTLLISAVCRAQEAAEVVAEVAPEIPGRLTLMDMMQEGGVVFGLDHRIPNGTPIENYRYYVDTAREILGLPQRDLKSKGWARMAF